MGSLGVTGIARITRDSELRKSTNGVWYSFGIAAFRRGVKEGKQTADFFDADHYSKMENPELARKLTKGRLIYIESGYLRNDQFKGTDGKEKNRIKIMVNNFEVLNDDQAPSQPVVKVETTSTHPTDLPPPMMYNKKPDVDPAGKKYFEDLKKKEATVEVKPVIKEEIEYVFDPEEEEPPF